MAKYWTEMTNRDDHTSVTKEPCEMCGSKDNKAVYHYDDGSVSWHCHTPGCKNHKNSKASLESHIGGINLTPLDLRGSTKFPKGLPKRGLSKEAMDKYNILYHKKDKVCIFPYYRSPEQDFSSYAKYRNKKKKFWWEGDSKNPDLFGQYFSFNSPSNRKVLIITEGEFDAVAAHQMTGYAAVSIPTGADGAVKVIKQHLQWIEKFEKIFICFDSDEPGKIAASEVMQVIAPGKGYRVNLEYGKDACEYLLIDDGVDKFKEDLRQAQAREINSLQNENATIESVFNYLDEISSNEGYSTGFTALDPVFKLRNQEITTIYADTSVGKSTFCRQLSANWLRMQETGVLIFSLEEDKIKYFIKTINMMLDGDITKDKQKEYTLEYASRLRLANVNTYDLDKVAEAITYGVRSFNVGLVIFDNVTSFCSQDDKSFQDKMRMLYTKMVALGKELNHHTIMVSHTRRDKDRKGIPDLHAAIGCSAIEQFSDNVIALSRDEGVDEMWLAIRKQRDNGLVGEIDTSIKWNHDSHCFDGINLGSGGKIEKVKDSSSNHGQKKEENSNNRKDGRGLPISSKENGKVRQQDGATSQSDARGIFKRNDGGKNSQSDKAIFSRNKGTTKLQSRLSDNDEKRAEAMARNKGALEAARLYKTNKLAPFPLGKINISREGLDNVITEQDKNDLQRLRRQIRVTDCFGGDVAQSVADTIRDGSVTDELHDIKRNIEQALIEMFEQEQFRDGDEGFNKPNHINKEIKREIDLYEELFGHGAFELLQERYMNHKDFDLYWKESERSLEEYPRTMFNTWNYGHLTLDGTTEKKLNK